MRWRKMRLINEILNHELLFRYLYDDMTTLFYDSLCTYANMTYDYANSIINIIMDLMNLNLSCLAKYSHNKKIEVIQNLSEILVAVRIDDSAVIREAISSGQSRRFWGDSGGDQTLNCCTMNRRQNHVKILNHLNHPVKVTNDSQLIQPHELPNQSSKKKPNQLRITNSDHHYC